MLSVATLVTGCFEIADPAAPCTAIDLGDADPSTVVNNEMAPVLALAADFDKTDTPFLLHYVCPYEGASQADCKLTRTELTGPSGENAVLVTSAGNYVVVTDQDTRQIKRFPITWQGLGAAKTSGVDGLPVRLLASLRNSDWVIARDLDGNLLRYHPAKTSASRIAADHDGMMLAAVGEQHIVGRIVLGEDREELYLIPIDDELSYLHRGPVRLGARDRIASRIVFAPGDLTVSVTYGTGDSAETKVFQVPDGGLMQRFSGELVSGRAALEELPGMRAVSPDGSHLAYRTPQGSLAMRDIENAASCVVQSATHEKTRVAGFSASGLLYFETTTGPGQTSVKTWVPHDQHRVELSRLDEGYTLNAVPARSGGDAEDTPWAVGLNEGTLVGLQEALQPQSLGLANPVFLPRDDDHLWALNTTRDVGTRTLEIKRVKPRWSNQMRALAFDDPTDPDFEESDANEDDVVENGEGPLRVILSDPRRACLSTGAPGSWAYACGEASDRNFLAATPPSSEDPFSNPTPEPEVVPDQDKTCPAGGTPVGQATGNCFEYNGCCYRSSQTVCGMAECYEPNDCLFDDINPGHFRYLYCGNPSDGPN